MTSENRERIDKAIDDSIADGIVSESISTPNGGSRSVSTSSPEVLIRAKRARLSDIGASVLARTGLAKPYCVTYPTFN